MTKATPESAAPSMTGTHSAGQLPPSMAAMAEPACHPEMADAARPTADAAGVIVPAAGPGLGGVSWRVRRRQPDRRGPAGVAPAAIRPLSARDRPVRPERVHRARFEE